MNKIIILNGPNLNLLGEREKEKYGNTSLKNIEDSCKEFAKKNSVDLSLFQSNIEGELVEEIQKSGIPTKDAKNFLNDILEVLYLFSRRISLGPIEKDLSISETEIQIKFTPQIFTSVFYFYYSSNI